MEGRKRAQCNPLRELQREVTGWCGCDTRKRPKTSAVGQLTAAEH